MHGISISQAVTIAKTHFLITGDVSVLDGDEDFNFKITTASTSYVLKISSANLQRLETQNKVLHRRFIAFNVVAVVCNQCIRTQSQ